MVGSSGQHKCALIFSGVLLLVLGAGITASGFIYDFLDPYDDISTSDSLYFTHVQYWLGIPLFVLGVFVIATSCCKVTCLVVLGLVLASLLLVASICGVVLEGPVWRGLLKEATFLNDNAQCDNDNNGICNCNRLNVPLSCNEIKYVAVLNSIMVIFSILAIVVCQFCCFVYFRILGWMLHIRYEDPIDDYYAKAVGSTFINGPHGRGAHGRGANGHARANPVALNTFNQ